MAFQKWSFHANSPKILKKEFHSSVVLTINTRIFFSIQKMLKFKPEERISAADAMRHPYFTQDQENRINNSWRLMSLKKKLRFQQKRFLWLPNDHTNHSTDPQPTFYSPIRNWKKSYWNLVYKKTQGQKFTIYSKIHILKISFFT